MITNFPVNARKHWFYLVAPLIVAADIYITLSSRGEISRLIEAGLLFDLTVLIPCFYWLCYRGRGRKAVVRAGALACLGIWAALKLVPESEHQILGYVAPLRYLGMAVLLWLELAIVLAVYRAIYKGGSPAEAVAHAQVATDLPPWLARLMVLEAILWRKAWLLLKRLFGVK